jgi:hypothetical protein
VTAANRRRCDIRFVLSIVTSTDFEAVATSHRLQLGARRLDAWQLLAED